MSTTALRTSPISLRVRWERIALIAILALAAVLCLWNLTENGYSNEYYAAAAKAGSESWRALFFGSLDPSSFITVDKPPLSLWLMGLSARAFGFSSFSILLPEALCTIAAVWLLYATVRRLWGTTAGLLAAAALALTPVTIAIGRVNNPDALLVLLMVTSAYLVVRAIESGKTKHLAWAGALVGLAFMTKLLQGWMIAPALGAAYLLAGPPRLRVRCKQLAIAGATMVAVSAAWPVAVSLWPGSKPYIGGSTNGSIWNLIFGYDGFGRLFGQGGGAGGGGGITFGGAPGLLRMFNEQVGGQVAWLIPLAAIGLAVGLWMTRRAPRTDRARAGWVLFGAWALVCVAVFSSQRGFPSLLRERTRARGRGTRGRRRRDAGSLGAPLVGRGRRVGSRDRGLGRARGGAARADAELRAGAADADSDRRCDRDRRERCVALGSPAGIRARGGGDSGRIAGRTSVLQLREPRPVAQR